MSKLSDSTFGAPGFEAEKKQLNATIQAEIIEAKRIQKQTGCTYTEALKLAKAGAPAAMIGGK